jgi:uncharacterized glyoxalase superfamily protein PhnB
MPLDGHKKPRPRRHDMTPSLSPDLVVSDVNRSVRFYKDALGLLEEDRVDTPDGPVFAMLAREGCRIMLETAKTQIDEIKGFLAVHGPRATLTLYLTTPNLEADQARLRKAAVAFDGPVTRPYGMKEVSFRDPDGYNWTIGEKVA